MRLTVITRFAIDGEEFDSPERAEKHIEERIFKHLEKGLGDALRGMEDCHGASIAYSEKSKMKLALMQYVLDNRDDLAALLSADLSVSDED